MKLFFLLVPWLVCPLWGVSFLGASGQGPASWASIEVPEAQEAETVRLVEAKGLVALSWSNALVEVSAFDATELRPVGSLESTLSPWDPRWDPWLRSLKPVFRPKTGVSRIWVDSARVDEARNLLKSAPAGEAPSSEARRVTGWLLLGLAVIYLGVRLGAELMTGFGGTWRRWWWLAGPLVVILGGSLMVGGIGFLTVNHPVRPEASWLQHVWYQQSWPFGAEWKDWKPGTPWAYKSYDRQAGRIVEAKTLLSAPNDAWAKKLYSDLDQHHVARLFPPENP